MFHPKKAFSIKRIFDAMKNYFFHFISQFELKNMFLTTHFLETSLNLETFHQLKLILYRFQSTQSASKNIDIAIDFLFNFSTQFAQTELLVYWWNNNRKLLETLERFLFSFLSLARAIRLINISRLCRVVLSMLKGFYMDDVTKALIKIEPKHFSNLSSLSWRIKM